MLSRNPLLPVLLAFATVLIAAAGLYQTPLLDWPGNTARPDYIVQLELPEAETLALPDVVGGEDTSKPLIVIDAGHGGNDYGATGGGQREKDIVLGLARALYDRLIAEGQVRVALTRRDDRFLVLEERAEIARRLDADLFLSIHADSAGDVEGASGASIYTLSNEASSATAARYAARENSADMVNGVVLDRENATVNTILVELSQRRAVEEAIAFAQEIEEAGQGRFAFRDPARRSAPFVVLKAPDIPSVLFEAGFISNSDEARAMSSAEGQERFADIMATAIANYFAQLAPAQEPEESARPSIGSVL